MNYYPLTSCNTSVDVYELENTNTPQNQDHDTSYSYITENTGGVSGPTSLSQDNNQNLTAADIRGTAEQSVGEGDYVQTYQQILSDQSNITQLNYGTYEYTTPSTSGLNLQGYPLQAQQQQTTESQYNVNYGEYWYPAPFQNDASGTSGLNLQSYPLQAQQQQATESQYNVNYGEYWYTAPFQNDASGTSGLNLQNYPFQAQQQQTTENQYEVNYEEYGYTVPPQNDASSTSELNLQGYPLQAQQQQTTENQYEVNYEEYGYTVPPQNDASSTSELNLQGYPLQAQQQQATESQYNVNYGEYGDTVPPQNDASSTSGLNLQSYPLQAQQQQTTESQYDINYVQYECTIPFQSEEASTSELNQQNYPLQNEKQQIMENQYDITLGTHEHNEITPSNKHTCISYPAETDVHSHIFNVPSFAFVNFKFGISLLSWANKTYSLIIREIGIGDIEKKLESMVLKQNNLNNAKKYDKQNISLLLHHLEKVFMSLITEEIETIEEEYEIDIRQGMSVENLRRAAINNSSFFKKLFEKCSHIIENNIADDIYKNIPYKIFTQTALREGSCFIFNKKSHLRKFSSIIISSISNLKERIIRFITDSEPKIILSLFFGNFCGLHLQRRLLQEIKDISDRILYNIVTYAIPHGIRSNTEISLAINLYTDTGTIPSHSVSGFYDYIHSAVYMFKGEIFSKIKKYRLFYNDSSGAVVKASENDIEIFSNRFLEYFKYAAICSYRQQLVSTYNDSTNPSNIQNAGVYDIECASRININSSHLHNGIYFLATKSSSFRHSKLEDFFLLEMKKYIRSANIKNLEFSCFYSNIISIVANIISYKLELIESELSSHILIPGNDISTVKELILNSDYHLHQFSKICENEVSLIDQCDIPLSYGVNMIKCFWDTKIPSNPIPSTYKSSVSLVMPRQAKSKYSYSPELLLDVLRFAISELPSMVKSEIEKADQGFFVNALFKNFDGIAISKKSLEEISNLGKNILHSVHEKKIIMNTLEYIFHGTISSITTYENANESDLFYYIRSIVLSRGSKIGVLVDEVILSFENEIRRLSEESIILDGNTITLSTKDIENKLFNSFRSEIKLECINSLSEICTSRYTNYITKQFI
ncbi:hypothetical protein [Candidatus Ichthyocystis sparus]|uniref:hypothetical protein n=1 Tax=Candidatus Ichthyocystis sparus TaxID=1561004 RepID=UPI000B827511|nr:hypothetical protein [Candidatus Ichthyocystis sparus]